MRAKDKAQELITNYRFLLSLPGAPLGEHKDHVAKQCALAAVSEILIELHRCSEARVDLTEMPQALYKDRDNYWVSVQQELYKY